MNRTVVVTAAQREDEGNRRIRLNATYVTALESAGLVPLIVPPLRDAGSAEEVLSRVGGLVLTGGGDLDPELYGEPLHPRANPPQPERDATELALIHAARRRGLPVLGICRGIQAINVALGGTLVQDIPSQLENVLEHDARDARDRRTHEVRIEAGSRLARAIGAATISVNSLHHQSVAKVAPGLKVTATAPDGVVEGLESDDDWWMLAVQWHPEELSEADEHWDRGLFAAFADAVKNDR